ncbi:MAG: hypothetical protein EXQ96_06245, partial [Alphaproteobacteria bacterium]|nr:hypothetical protein [Alphaproteobacteria bacterium]
PRAHLRPMIDPERFRHDKSAYERPNFPYRCGRAAAWGKPCARGPETDGSCGGVAECRPVKRGDRFECRRPGSAGGACDIGPDSSGACSQRLPPCTPRPTLRRVRGRLGLIAVGLVMALIAALVGSTPSGQARLSSLNPGALTGPHAGFTAKDGCITCHAAHGEGAAGWLKAVFTSGDMTESCLKCHSFDGPAAAAHNVQFAERKDVTAPTCSECHREHRGVSANIARLTDEQCASCHKQKFTNFATQHPAFSKTYPYSARTGVKFDHVSHISRHFGESRVAERAPKTCVTCHDVDMNQRLPVVKGFDQACAGCHAQQVAQKEMVLLRLPEFDQRKIDRAKIRDTCGPTIEEMKAMEEKAKAMAAGRKPKEPEAEDYESISTEEMSPIGAYLIGVVADDKDSYAKPMEGFLQDLVDDGAAALMEKIKDLGGKAERLLTGMNPEAIKRVACAWARNQEYELPAEAEMGGWYGDRIEFRYRPQLHADPVARAWIEFAVARVAAAGDDEERDRAKAMRDELLSTRDGVGNCMKCHAVVKATDAGQDAEKLEPVWGYRQATRRPHFWFSHPPHLRLPGLVTADLEKVEQGCQTCHRLDAKADYASGFAAMDRSQFVSNFSGMTSNTCAQCHNEKAVREDCQLCHRYHREPALRVEVTSNARRP